jgi:hypothetical protein
MDWRIPALRKDLSRYYTGTETFLTALTGEYRLDKSAREVRRIIEAMSLTAPNARHLESVTDRLAVLAEELESYAESPRDRLYGMWEGDGVARHDPVTGPENPIAPPLVMRVVEDGWVEGEVMLGLPTRVHDRGARWRVRGAARCSTRGSESPCRKQWGHRQPRDQLSASYTPVCTVDCEGEAVEERGT